MAPKKIGVHGTDAEVKRDRSDNATATKDKKPKVPDITKEEFEQHAKSLDLGATFTNRFADAKTFKKGSYGFFLNDKITVMVNGKPVKCQANILLTVVNSKPQEDGDEAGE